MTNDEKRSSMAHLMVRMLGRIDGTNTDKWIDHYAGKFIEIWGRDEADSIVAKLRSDMNHNLIVGKFTLKVLEKLRG